VVVQGTNVAHERSSVNHRCLLLTDHVFPIMVRWGLVFVVFEGVPLCQEVVVTLVTSLDPPGRVHGTGPGRSGQVTQRRVEGLLHVRHLLGEDVRQGALLEVVAAKVANLESGVFVWKGKV